MGEDTKCEKLSRTLRLYQKISTLIFYSVKLSGKSQKLNILRNVSKPLKITFKNLLNFAPSIRKTLPFLII